MINFANRAERTDAFRRNTPFGVQPWVDIFSVTGYEMQDILSRLATMNRPRLLVRAARVGALEYRRDIHLPRLLGRTELPRSIEALVHLSELESELNIRRISNEAGYSVANHIDVLIAMVAEARLAQAHRRTSA